MLAGVVLAGGKSSRMGTDKSLLTLPDSHLSLLEHSQKKLALLCNTNVFISGSQHNNGIADIIPNCGPLSGIHGAITHIEMYHPDMSELLVVAVDMPDLGTDNLNHLLTVGREKHCLCAFENCYLPLYIPLSVEVTEYLDRVLKAQSVEAIMQPKQQRFSVKVMLDSLQGLQIQPLKKAQLDNINTPVQWQQRCSQPPFTKAYK